MGIIDIRHNEKEETITILTPSACGKHYALEVDVDEAGLLAKRLTGKNEKVKVRHNKAEAHEHKSAFYHIFIDIDMQKELKDALTLEWKYATGKAKRPTDTKFDLQAHFKTMEVKKKEPEKAPSKKRRFKKTTKY